MLTTQFSVVHRFRKLGSSVMKADKGTIGLFDKVSSKRDKSLRKAGTYVLSQGMKIRNYLINNQMAELKEKTLKS